MYYLVAVLVLTIGSGIITPQINIPGSKARKHYCLFVFFLLFLFSALRGSSVGIDTGNRARSYSVIHDYSFDYFLSRIDAEYLYRIIIWLFTRISENPYLMEAFFAGVVLGVHVWFNYLYAKELPFALALFIIFNYSATMNTTRQYLAISLFLVALHYIIHKKLIKAVLIILLSSQFHTSAYLGLLFCLLALKKVYVNKRIFLLMIPAAVFAVISYSAITNLIMQIFPQYSRYLNDSFFMSSSRISIPWIALYVLISILLFFRFNAKEKEDKKLHLSYRNQNTDDNAFGVLSIVFLVYVASDISAFFIRIIYRIMRYYYIGFTILLPDVACSFVKKDTSNRIILYVVFMLLALVVAFVEFSANKYRIFPYVFFWQ